MVILMKDQIGKLTDIVVIREPMSHVYDANPKKDSKSRCILVGLCSTPVIIANNPNPNPRKRQQTAEYTDFGKVSGERLGCGGFSFAPKLLIKLKTLTWA